MNERVAPLSIHRFYRPAAAAGDNAAAGIYITAGRLVRRITAQSLSDDCFNFRRVVALSALIILDTISCTLCSISCVVVVRCQFACE